MEELQLLSTVIIILRNRSNVNRENEKSLKKFEEMIGVPRWVDLDNIIVRRETVVENGCDVDRDIVYL